MVSAKRGNVMHVLKSTMRKSAAAVSKQLAALMISTSSSPTAASNFSLQKLFLELCIQITPLPNPLVIQVRHRLQIEFTVNLCVVFFVCSGNKLAVDN